MPRLSILGAQQQRDAAIKQAEDLGIAKMIRLICDQVEDKTQPLPGSGVIVKFDPSMRFLRAYRQENEGRIVFSARDHSTTMGLKTKIYAFRYGKWVDSLIETYERTVHLVKHQDAVDLERKFSPLEGDWNDP